MLIYRSPGHAKLFFEIFFYFALMNNTKVYQLIHALTESDRAKISSILNNASENTPTLHYSLYQLISDHLSGNKDQRLDRHEIWSILYPDQPFKDSTLRKLCADLVKALEQAFAILYLNENMDIQTLFYLQFLKNRNYPSSFFGKEVKKVKRQRSTHQILSGQEYYENFKIEELEYLNKNITGSAWTKSNIEKLDQNINSFFILEKLRLALSIFSRQRYIQFEKDLPFLELIYKVIQSGQYQEHPLILLYYYAVMTYDGEDKDEMYLRLKEGLLEHLDTLHPERMRELTTIALSFCIGKLNHNQTEYYSEALDWYKLMIQNNILLDQEHLAATTFRNIVLLAIRMNEYEWATEFVQSYAGFLKPELQESTKMLSMGQILFNKKEYQEVIGYMMNVDYIHVSYNLQSKLILAATYYELGEYDVLISFLHTFSTYLRRKKSELSSEKYDRHQKFITLLNQMIRIPPRHTEEWEAISERLKNDPEVVSHHWLMEKTREKLT